MKISKSLIVAFAFTAFHISSAVAGPPVTVTFKNLGTQTATYTPITNNEAITKANASPTPQASVTAKSSALAQAKFQNGIIRPRLVVGRPAP
jgi:hypothetical protein